MCCEQQGKGRMFIKVFYNREHKVSKTWSNRGPEATRWDEAHAEALAALTHPAATASQDPRCASGGLRTRPQQTPPLCGVSGGQCAEPPGRAKRRQ